MPMSFVRKTLQAAAAMSVASMLSGCNLLVLNPAGDIAARLRAVVDGR